MKRYFIEKVECGVSEGGMACGPVGGAVIVSVKFNDGKSSRWISNAEVDGIPNFFITPEDTFEEQMKEDLDDKVVDYLNKHLITEFEGIDLDGYYGVFYCAKKHPKDPAAALLRYIVTLTRCDSEDVEPLIQRATGKYIDEVDIPKSDLEEDYDEDYEEEEEEDDEE